MQIKTNPAYKQLIEIALESHRNNRSPDGVASEDVTRARLYCYAFRTQAIGTFHATRLAVEECSIASPLAIAFRDRAIETLEDLASQAMDAVPSDYRAVISTLHRYHRGITRVDESLGKLAQEVNHAEIERIGQRFRNTVEQITSGNGIYLTQDRGAPEQASFVVPNLGIVIVPLVYGDHHSWNLAYLAGEARDVPTHRHYDGVEIHLGFNPTHGETVLGGYRAPVEEGYAMPIPPSTDHGWVNTSEKTHHVPFIFGSLKHGGWGVFLDVEAQPKPVEELQQVSRESFQFDKMVYLEREIERAENLAGSGRKVLIPFSATNRNDSGGLELALTSVDAAGSTFPTNDYRIVSVVRGAGTISIEGIKQPLQQHDHFGIPAGMQAVLKKTGSTPMVVLDSLIRTGKIRL